MLIVMNIAILGHFLFCCNISPQYHSIIPLTFSQIVLSFIYHLELMVLQEQRDWGYVYTWKQVGSIREFRRFINRWHFKSGDVQGDSEGRRRQGISDIREVQENINTFTFGVLKKWREARFFADEIRSHFFIWIMKRKGKHSRVLSCYKQNCSKCFFNAPHLSPTR